MLRLPWTSLDGGGASHELATRSTNNRCSLQCSTKCLPRWRMTWHGTASDGHWSYFKEWTLFFVGSARIVAMEASPLGWKTWFVVVGGGLTARDPYLGLPFCHWRSQCVILSLRDVRFSGFICWRTEDETGMILVIPQSGCLNLDGASGAFLTVEAIW